MAKQVINIGTAPNTGTGDPLRTAFTKANNNFTELYDLTSATQAALESLPPIPTDIGQLTDLNHILDDNDNSLQNNGHVIELDTNGVTIFPLGATIGPEGMGWTGLSNGVTEAPISLLYKTNTGNWQAAVTLFGGNDTDGEGQVALYTYNATTQQSYQWTFGADGSLQLPINGSLKDSNGNAIPIKGSAVTDEPTMNGVLTEVVSVPASNTNWAHGTGVSGGISNANLSFSVTNGVPSFTINDPGLSGRYVGENIFTINGSVLGGTDGIDDMVIQVSATANTGSGIIDLTKQTHVLQNGDYTLANGYEGQVLHFVPKLDTTNLFGNVWIQLSNVRHINPQEARTYDYTNAWWSPFSKPTDNWTQNSVATAVFADGAWNVTGGALD